MPPQAAFDLSAARGGANNSQTPEQRSALKGAPHLSGVVRGFEESF